MATPWSKERLQPDLTTPRSEEQIQPDLATPRSVVRIQPDLAIPHSEEQIQTTPSWPEKQFQPDLTTHWQEKRFEPSLAEPFGLPSVCTHWPVERNQPSLAPWPVEQNQPSLATPFDLPSVDENSIDEEFQDLGLNEFEEQFQSDFTTSWPEEALQPSLATPWQEKKLEPSLVEPIGLPPVGPHWPVERNQPSSAPWPVERNQHSFATPFNLPSVDEDSIDEEFEDLGSYEFEEQFQSDFLVRCLEDMVPFIEPDDVNTLVHLSVKKNLVSIDVEKSIEAMHENITPQQKFRYLIWDIYSKRQPSLTKFLRHSIDLPYIQSHSRYLSPSFDATPWNMHSLVRSSERPIKKENDVGVFLRLLATLPSGKCLAHDYQSKSAYSVISKIANVFKKKSSIYDLLVKRFSDPRLIRENQPGCKKERINVDEKKDFFMLLLEGCAGRIKDNVAYEWYKNGTYLGQNSPLMCIRIADIIVEGEYTMRRNNKLMASITLCLRTLMDNFRQDLTQRYLETVNVEWPKVKQNTYIKLAVIKSDKSDNLSSYVYQTIRGDADDIHREKGETDYKRAFESIQHGERVIVQGRPGSGKTTLVHKLSRDWADHSIEWGHVKALFLIHLRGFRSRSSINLTDFLECYFTGEDTIKSINDYIISKDGMGICFILDGLDEYQPDDGTVFVFKLIEKKVLSKAIVIVASRPAAVAKYRSTGNNVEVLGFFKNQISDYIDSYKFRSTSSSFMLKEYLMNRPNIHYMCYLPIQLAMICFLYDHFEENGNIFPDTETEVYEQFARHMLLRTFYRQKENFYLTSIFSLPEVEGKLLRNICTLAFDKTFSSMQVLEQADVDLFCAQIDTNSCLGLLTVDRKATICGFQNMYTFCHLTFQEFLAACYVFLSSEDKQPMLIEMCKEKQHMTVVLKFFCGLADFESDNAAMFKSITNSPHLNSLEKIQCSFESKQPITCQHVAKNNTLNITENFLTTRDWWSIRFVIKNASYNPVKCLHLNYSVITEDGTKALTKSIGEECHLPTIQKFKILGNFDCLPLFFINCLHQLQVFCTSVNNRIINVKALYDLRHSNIKIIQFHDNNVPKLAIKFDFVPLKHFLSLSSDVIKKETTSLNFVSILSHIIEKSLNSVNAFLAAELKSQLHTICKSSKCIKLSGTVKNDFKENMMIVASGSQQIQEDVDFILRIQKQTKNFATSNFTLELDTIHFGNCLIVIFVLSTTKNTYFKLFILPNGYVNKLSQKCMDNVESFELEESFHSPKKYLRRLSICKNPNEDLELQQLFDHTLEQLEIKCDEIKHCSYFTESLNKCTELKSFSFHVDYNKTVDCPSSETILVPAMRYMINSLSLKKIEVLKLKNCNLNGILSLSLVPALRTWITLRELCLKNCSITGKSVTSLVQAITACTQLTALDLSCNDIGNEGCQALAVSMLHKCSEICSFPHLKRLDLSNCNINNAGISFLANVLKNYSSLKFLGMARTTLKNLSLEELFLSFQNSKNLTEIDLSHSALESFSVFSTPLLKSLQILKLRACKPKDISLAPLMKNEFLMSSLHVLDLSENNWPVSDLIQMFDLTKGLQELSLSDLSLFVNDTKYLAGALNKLRNLNVLRFNGFSMTLVDPEFVQFITNENITILELRDLECKKSVYCEICSKVKYATSLHSLDLSHNLEINNASRMLSESIMHCQKLNILRLCDCGIRKNEADELAAAIIACESIRSIDMSQNDFDDVHNELISSKFAYCDHLITFQV